MFNISEVVEILSRILGTDTEVEAVKCDKGNGVIKDGIGIKPTDSKTEGVFYLDFANASMNSMDVAARILRAYRDELKYGFKIPSNEYIHDLMSNYNLAKERLYIKLSSCPSSDLVKATAFCDLYMTAYIKLANTCDEGIIGVTKGILDSWDIDEETLFEDALLNAKKKERILSQTLLEVACGISESCGYPSSPFEGGGLLESIIVLTNRERNFGASAVMLSSDLPDEFYLIPSSLHEVMIVPADMITDPSELVGIVRIVNCTSVEQQDVLSYNVYHCVNGVYSILGSEMEASL